jgi:hypothetical protein
VPGGYGNSALGSVSYAAGEGAAAIHTGAVVWSTPEDPFTSTANYQFLVDAPGGLGVNTNAPQSQLHVVDTQNGDGSFLSRHVATFENDAVGNSPDVLALQVSGESNPDGTVNFVTFFDSGGAIAAIEGNGSGGVTYKTSGADFAEYLPLALPGLEVEPGAILGLVDGALSSDTGNAERVLVVSGSPAFVGNAAEAEGNEGMALVAFLGQVEARARGPVAAGDVLVASGRNDGTAVAVAPADLNPAMASQIVGRALESKPGGGTGLVLTLVGLPTDDLWAARLAAVEAQLAESKRDAAAGTVPWWAMGLLVVGLYVFDRGILRRAS